jgi:hypothetical protein
MTVLVVEPLAVDHAVRQVLLGPRAGLGAGEPLRVPVAIFILVVYPAVVLHGTGGTANVRAGRAALALVDGYGVGWMVGT